MAYETTETYRNSHSYQLGGILILKIIQLMIVQFTSLKNLLSATYKFLQGDNSDNKLLCRQIPFTET